MSDLWDAKVAALDARERDAAAKFRRDVGLAQERYDSAMAQIEESRQTLRDKSDEPVVLARRTDRGPRARRYHTSDACGWRPYDNVRRLLLSEAQEEGLKLCSSAFCRGAYHRWKASRQTPLAN